MKENKLKAYILTEWGDHSSKYVCVIAPDIPEGVIPTRPDRGILGIRNRPARGKRSLYWSFEIQSCPESMEARKALEEDMLCIFEAGYSDGERANPYG